MEQATSRSGPVLGVVGAPGGPGDLGDSDLADEIELYGAVVVAASEAERPLTATEIDRALGLRCCRHHGGGEGGAVA